MPPASPRIRFVVPGNIRHNSGGNVYNAALARGLSALGVAVETCPLDGDWPGGTPEDRRRLASLARGLQQLRQVLQPFRGAALRVAIAHQAQRVEEQG